MKYLLPLLLALACAHPKPIPVPTPEPASLPNTSLIDPAKPVWTPAVGSVVPFPVVCLEPDLAAQIGGELRRRSSYAKDLRALQSHLDALSLAEANARTGAEHVFHVKVAHRRILAAAGGALVGGVVLGLALGR